MTYDRIRHQYTLNLRGLESMLAKAQQTGRKVNGYTAEQLAAHVAEYRRLATLDDAAMAAHLTRGPSNGA